MHEIVRSGVLYKRGRGEGIFARKNWKPRYFEVTWNSLRYYDYHQGTLKGSIDLFHCKPQDIETMPEDCKKTGNSDSTIWRIAIQTHDRRLFLSMQTESEMNSWFASIRHVLHTNAQERNSCPQFTSKPWIASPLSLKERHLSTDRRSFTMQRIPMLEQNDMKRTL